VKRRRRLLWALGALVAGGVWAGAGMLMLARAASDIRAGTAAINRARASAELVDLAAGTPVADVRLARASFDRAHRRATSPVLLPVRLVPVIGRQLESVAALSGAASDVGQVILDTMLQGQLLLERTPANHPERVALVQRLSVIAGDASRRLDAVDLGPGIGLFGRLADARDQLSTELGSLQDQVERGSVGAAGVAEMLTGPRRYLVFAANNAEMRAGSGMFLSVGELEIDNLGMRLVNMRSVVDVPVPKGAVPMDGDLADRWGWLAPNVEWRNLMSSPDFAENAELAARMWVAAGNRPVDGVLAIDPVGLQAVLSATGPVHVDGRVIDAGNVVDELLHGQYVRYASRPRSDRREELGEIARAAFEALDTSSVPNLAKAMTAAADGRHFMAWSSKPVQQAGWLALGVDGSLRSDSLLVSILNRGGNKLDQFLQVAADLSFAPKETDTEVTLKITLTNATPLKGEPAYVAGEDPNSGVPQNVYLGILSVNVPGQAYGLRIDDSDTYAVAGADGPTGVVGLQLRVDHQTSRTAIVRFTLPGDHGRVRVEPSARVPAITWTGPGGTWPDGAPFDIPYAAH
jgi:hypothetical protein